MEINRKTASTINRAADMIESIAEELRSSHSINGAWNITDEVDQKAKDEHDDMKALASDLREICGNDENNLHPR